MSFNATTPANTTLTIDARAGNTSTPDGTWTDWQTNISSGGNFPSNFSGNQYIQYRVNMATTDNAATPSLDDITVNFKYITPTSSSVSQTSDSDFTAGSNSNTQVSGSGSAGKVEMTERSVYAVGENFIGKSSTRSNTWVNMKADAGPLEAVQFQDSNNGWVVGGQTWHATAMKTTDGGQTWGSSHDFGSNAMDIQFVNSNTGWVTGGWGQTTFKTTDGGTNWVQKRGGQAASTTKECFIDGQTGWLGTDSGILLKTTDGGTTWSSQDSGAGKSIRDISCLDADNIVIATVGSNDAGIYKSTDGGVTWSNPLSNYAYTYGIYFINSNIGWAAGNARTGRIVWKTTDGGSSWNQIYLSVDSHGFYDIQFSDEYLGWAVGGNGYIYKTTDGGTTWNSLTSGTTSSINEISIAPSSGSSVFTSSVIDLGQSSYPTTLSYNATTPTNTSVTVDVRAGDTATPDGTWTDWKTNISSSGSIRNLDAHRYVQYRANLSSSNASVTPSLDDITINYDYYASSNALTSTSIANINFNTEGEYVQENAANGTDFGDGKVLLQSSEGNDSYTKLLLHTDGANNSTTFTDSSSSAKTITSYGNAKISTAQKRFGASSGYFDRTANTYLTAPASADWQFGSGDFTVDFWFFPDDSSDSYILGSSQEAGKREWELYAGAGAVTKNLMFVYSTTGTGWQRTMTGNNVLTVNQWNHIAVTRSGNDFKVYANGSVVALGTYADTIYASDSPLYAGATYDGGSYYYTGGYLDEIRISKGIARWNSDFSSSLPSSYGGYPLAPYYATTNDSSQISALNYEHITGATITQTTPDNTSIKYLISFDDRSTWKYWNGSAWTTSTLDDLQTNGMSKATIEGLSQANWESTGGFVVGTGTLDFAADLSSSDASYTPELDNIAVTYIPLPASLTSSAYNTTSFANVLSKIQWSETLPTGADIQFQVRTAPDSGSNTPGTWGSWMGPDGTSGSYFTDPSGGETMPSAVTDLTDDQWIQYKAFLSTTETGSNPTLSDVTMTYVVNAPPEVQNVTASQGSDGIVTVNYEVRDPDTDTGANQNQLGITLQYCTANCSVVGSETWTTAVTTSGHAGAVTGIEQTNWASRTLTWNAKTDYNNQYNNTNFKVRIRANDSEGANNYGYGSSSTFTIDTKNPTGLSMVIDNSANTLTMATPSDDSSYQMSVTNGSSTCSSSTFMAFASPYTDSGLTDDPATVCVRIKDAYGNYSDITTTTPAHPAVIAYYDVSQPDIDDYREFITWSAISASQVGDGFLRYNIWRSVDGGAYSIMYQETDREKNYYSEGELDTTKTYYYKVTAEDTSHNISNFTDVVFDNPDSQGSTDRTPPTISNVTISSINTTSARITWTTDEFSDSSVGYSPDETYLPELGNASIVKGDENDPNSTTDPWHAITLTGLQPGTTYHVRIKSRDVRGNLGQVDGDSPGNNDTSVFQFTTHDGPAISNVTIPSVSNNQATISWRTNTDSSSYVASSTGIDNAGNLEEPVTVIGTTDFVGGSAPFTHEQTIVELTEGTKYYFYVKSIDAADNEAIDNNGGEYYELTTTMDNDAPNLDSIETAIVSNTSAAVRWATNEPSSSQVKYSTHSGGPYTNSSVVTTMDRSHYVILTGLTSDTDYYYKVVSEDINGNESTSDENTFATLKDPGFQHDPLTEITDIETSIATDTKAVITFETDQAAQCSIEYGTQSGNYTEVPVAETGYNEEHSIHLPGLIFSTEYFYQISCQDNLETAISSDEYDFTTTEKRYTESEAGEQLGDKTAPSISGVSAGTIAGESATITWTTDEKSNSIVKYGITTGYEQVAGNVLALTDAENFVTNHEVVINNLVPGTKYYYGVVSYDESGNISESSQDSFTTKSPSTLSSIKVVSTSLNEALITWSTSKDLTTEVEYGITEEYGNTKTSNTVTKDHEISISGLKSATVYHFRVKGKDEDNNYYSSGDYTFEPKSPPKVSNANIDSITEHGSKIVVNTDIPTDILITYVNKSDETDTGSQGKPDLATRHEIELANLNSGTTYSYTVRVSDEQGNQTTSDPKEFTTSKDETAPAIDQVKNDSALTQNDKVQTIISWMTNEPATTSLTYREGINGEEKSIDSSAAFTNNHIVVITTFKPGNSLLL